MENLSFFSNLVFPHFESGFPKNIVFFLTYMMTQVISLFSPPPTLCGQPFLLLPRPVCVDQTLHSTSLAYCLAEKTCVVTDIYFEAAIQHEGFEVTLCGLSFIVILTRCPGKKCEDPSTMLVRGPEGFLFRNIPYNLVGCAYTRVNFPGIVATPEA